MLSVAFDENVHFFSVHTLEDFTVHVDLDATHPKQGSGRRTQCFDYNGPVVPSATVRLDCHQPIYGRYVMVTVTFASLTLCEVEVLAIPAVGGNRLI